MSFQLKLSLIIFSVIALVFIAFTYYQNSQVTNQRNCSEYGISADKSLTEKLGNTATLGNTSYKFKNGVCYQSINISYLNPYYNYTYIENAYTNLTISSCDTNEDGTSNGDKSLCEQYYRDYDNIFQKIYSQ